MIVQSKTTNHILCIILLLILGLQRSKQDCGPVLQEYDVAPGYSLRLIANNLTAPRTVTFDDDGNALVLQRLTSIIRINEGCNNFSVLLEQDDLNHGLVVRGDTLYASSSDIAYAWDYPSMENRRTIVKGMNNLPVWEKRDHLTRTLHISTRYPNLLIVTRGSSDNIDIASWNTSFGASQIRVFNLSSIPNEGYDWLDGDFIAWGVRNTVGIDTDWQGNLWGVDNGADQLTRNNVDIQFDQPAEELNFFGNITRPEETFYGYPACYTIWREDFDLQTGQQFALDPNSTYSDETCANESRAPLATFVPHGAPLDMKFFYGPTTEDGIEDDGSAWVTLHGSWNNEPPQGYQVVKVRMENITNDDGDVTIRPRVQQPSQEAYQPIFSNKDVTGCPQNRRCIRPVGIAFDKRGQMWMTSDDTGDMFIIGKSGDTAPSGLDYFPPTTTEQAQEAIEPIQRLEPTQAPSDTKKLQLNILIILVIGYFITIYFDIM